MSIGYDLADHLAAGRRAAEARMTSTCTIRRKTGTTTLVNRLKVPAWADVHVALPLRLDGSGGSDGGRRSVTVGDVVYETATGTAHIPATTSDLVDLDLIDVTAGEWSGTVWRVVKATMADQKTARRVPVEQVARPEEWA